MLYSITKTKSQENVKVEKRKKNSLTRTTALHEVTTFYTSKTW